MLDKVKSIEEKYNELSLALENVGDDYQKAAQISKERSDIEEVYEKARQYRLIWEQIQESKQLLDEDDEEIKELAQLDLENLEQKLEGRGWW